MACMVCLGRRRSSVILVFGKYVAAPLGSARAAQERMVYTRTTSAHCTHHGTAHTSKIVRDDISTCWYPARPWRAGADPTPPRTRSHSLRSISRCHAHARKNIIKTHTQIASLVTRASQAHASFIHPTHVLLSLMPRSHDLFTSCRSQKKRMRPAAAVEAIDASSQGRGKASSRFLLAAVLTTLMALASATNHDR